MTPIEHMRQCLVRQLILYRVNRDTESIEALRHLTNYEELKAEAERQWKLGNRGEEGKWFE